jgi:hypothetical protein
MTPKCESKIRRKCTHRKEGDAEIQNKERESPLCTSEVRQHRWVGDQSLQELQPTLLK